MRLALMCLLLAAGSPVFAQEVTRESGSVIGLMALPQRITGRVEPDAGFSVRQWPGTYFEAQVIGPITYFRVGPGDVSLRVKVDDGPPVAVVKPAPGLYRIGGLSAGPHRLRIDVASESQGGPTSFGGFLAPAGAAMPISAARVRQIEFIGDSHTVGYGNTSSTRQCTEDQVWEATDTSRGVAAQTATRYGADYEVNAISGRGVVRNYNGGPGDVLPVAYPFILFDHAQTLHDRDWRPQVIAISLGTNDFSTPLRPGEPWKTRDALHADFEDGYVRFVGKVRAANPGAYIVLWSTSYGDGEIKAEVAKVAERLRRAGDTRVGYVAVDNLDFSSCNFHPSVTDDGKIASAIAAALDGQADVWRVAAVRADNGQGEDMNKHVIAGALALAGAAGGATAQTAQSSPTAAASVPAAGTGQGLADKLINQPASAVWSVFGSGQTTRVLPTGGPQNYPATRVTVSTKGANAWDVGAASPIVKSIAAGDTVLVAIYLRAPMLKDGETTTISYFGLNMGAAPYDIIAQAPATVTNQWKLFYASGRAARAYAPDAVAAGLHLASEKHVIDLGPVRVFDLGQDVDPARLPKNG